MDPKKKDTTKKAKPKKNGALKKKEIVAKHKEVSSASIGEKKNYNEAVGRRKTAIARVRLYDSKKGEKENFIVNGKDINEYFKTPKLQSVAREAFAETSATSDVSVLVKGGGVSSQAEAVRLGISRILVELHPEWRPKLKALGFLKRDPRMVERKKYGLRKARRPQQWRKR